MNVIVTGCSRGIGYGLVKKLSEYPDSYIIGISRNSSALKKIKSSLPSGKFDLIVFDLEDIFTTGTQLIDKIKSYTNRIDILINNSGHLINKDFENTEYDEALKLFNVNFFGAAGLIKLVSTLMSTQSHVVNIGSMAGFQGSIKFKGLAYYSASKAALSCLTECLASEYKEKGISFNCLALGSIQTEMLASAFPGFKAPLKPDDIASFISDFAVNGHKYFNGKTIPVSMSNP